MTKKLTVGELSRYLADLPDATEITFLNEDTGDNLRFTESWRESRMTRETPGEYVIALETEKAIVHI